MTLAPQDLPGATLIRCRFVGDWRNRDLRGAQLRECDLSLAIPDNQLADYIWSVPNWTPPARLEGPRYDTATRWPEGLDSRPVQ
jgi:hypothetical protein